jgi:hypothetical protein
MIATFNFSYRFTLSATLHLLPCQISDYIAVGRQKDGDDVMTICPQQELELPVASVHVQTIVTCRGS